MSFVRAASKVSRVGVRVPAHRATPVALNAQRTFSQSAVRKSDAHAEETFEEFTARYEESVEGLGRPGRNSGTTDCGQPLSRIDCIRSYSAASCLLNAGMRRNSKRSTMSSSSRYVCCARHAARTGFARCALSQMVGCCAPQQCANILQRNLNNCFAYDLVPSPAVITAALRAARRVNDFPSAVRVFEGTFFSAPHACASGHFVQKKSVDMSKNDATSEAALG